MQINQFRGTSIIIYGAIGTCLYRPFFIKSDSTNIEDFASYCDKSEINSYMESAGKCLCSPKFRTTTQHIATLISKQLSQLCSTFTVHVTFYPC